MQKAFSILTVFLGAFLLFLIQPMAAKALLPHFGGTSALWTACMLFFQLSLLAGYAFGHYLQRLSPKRQFAVFVITIIAAGALLRTENLLASVSYHGENPVISVLTRLAWALGPAFIMISVTAPVTQRWLHDSGHANPYILYSASNLASLAALVAYPLLIEPAIALKTQLLSWSFLVWLHFGLLITLGVFFLRNRHCSPDASSETLSTKDPHKESMGTKPVEAKPWKEFAVWCFLSLLGVATLLILTQHITQDVAPIPFLWVAPLALYLLTFIFVFASPMIYPRLLIRVLCPVLATMLLYPTLSGWDSPIISSLPLSLLCCFAFCWFFHGELSHRRPPATDLTRFYLALSLGGALGGIFQSVVAPLVFNEHYEILVLAVITAAVAAGLSIHSMQQYRRLMPLWLRVPTVSLPIACVIFVLTLTGFWIVSYSNKEFSGRNFYGIVRVFRDDDFRYASSGKTIHGIQRLDPNRASEPLAYYGRGSGLYSALQATESRSTRRIGGLGMGVGVMAAYLRASDTAVFMELNPLMREIAGTRFSFLRDALGSHTVLMGDGRQILESLAPQKFDILVVDAFAGSSIPTHLLTSEAFALYARHLVPDGLLVLHISNKHLDLAPLAKAQARTLGWSWVVINYTPSSQTKGAFASTYAIMGPSLDSSLFPLGPDAKRREPSSIRDIPAWRDDFSNLLGLIRLPE